jgi:hypothetical protein
MPKNNPTEQELEAMEHEKTGRVNALQQLLRNSQPDIVRALEGGMTQAEYAELRSDRKAWSEELATLLEEPPVPPEEPLTPDVLTAVIENAETLTQVEVTVEFVAGMMEGLGL